MFAVAVNVGIVPPLELGDACVGVTVPLPPLPVPFGIVIGPPIVGGETARAGAVFAVVGVVAAGVGFVATAGVGVGFMAVAGVVEVGETSGLAAAGGAEFVGKSRSSKSGIPPGGGGDEIESPLNRGGGGGGSLIPRSTRESGEPVAPGGPGTGDGDTAVRAGVGAGERVGLVVVGAGVGVSSSSSGSGAGGGGSGEYSPSSWIVFRPKT